MKIQRWSLVPLLLSVAAYFPFLHCRMLRMAGDEKVYVSQALEMSWKSNWFQQVLQDAPDYYKGPLHYWLLRLGMLIFGQNPWATLYMNVLLAFGGALALGALVRKHLPEWKTGPAWIASFFAVCIGIYAHTWTSQMEVELAGLFAIGIYLLDRIPLGSPGYLFWTFAAVIGWSKSPLHAVFIGTTAGLFWLLQGELLRRLRSLATWKGALWGVALCTAGYLPAYFSDRENFLRYYIERETFSKRSGSGQNWTVAVESAFGFYLFPWIFTALVSYFALIARAKAFFFDSRLKRLVTLGIATFLPSVLFFAFHPYHFENYNLPVISGIILCVATAWGALAIYPSRFWDLAYRIAAGLNLLLALAFPVALTWLVRHFSPMPSWWPDWLLPLSWVGAAVAVWGFFGFGRARWGKNPAAAALGLAVHFLAFGALFATLGEREMLDLRTYLEQHREGSARPTLVYYNVNRNIWSEWGYLNFWVPANVRGAHTAEALRAAIQANQTLLVPSKNGLIQDFKKFMEREFPQAQLEITPWKRWRTRGEGDSGSPVWKQVLEKKDLSLLETDYWIVRVKLAEKP